MDETALLAHATSWQKAAARLKDIKLHETILEDCVHQEGSMFFCCRHLDAMHYASIGDSFRPMCYLDFTLSDAFDELKSLYRLIPLHEWTTGGSRGEILERLAFFFKFSVGQESARVNGPDVCLNLEWSGRRPSKREVAIGLRNEKLPVALDLSARADWLRRGIKRLGLKEQVVPRIQGEKLVFDVQAPFRARSKLKDNSRSSNPLDVWISPVDGFETLLDCARNYLRESSDETLRSVSGRIEVPLEQYNQMVADVPGGYEGWQVQAFGGASNATQAWLAGDVTSRPTGRIPLGGGWYGGETTGISFNVCVVDTSNGPCLEIGSDNAGSSERLDQCSAMFGDLEFLPVA